MQRFEAMASTEGLGLLTAEHRPGGGEEGGVESWF